MKTLKQWQDSKLDLSKFLQPGDQVDDELFDYFLEVMPPACLSHTCLQIGEPVRHDEKGRPVYDTLEKIGNDWTYTGVKIQQPGQSFI
jgi:hypothetical protein